MVTYYQNAIHFVMGRKHQIHAQFSSLDYPILHNTLYEPMSGLTMDKLESHEEDNEGEMDIAISKCKIPTKPIGLQAHVVLFGSIAVKANQLW